MEARRWAWSGEEETLASTTAPIATSGYELRCRLGRSAGTLDDVDLRRCILGSAATGNSTRQREWLGSGVNIALALFHTAASGVSEVVRRPYHTGVRHLEPEGLLDAVRCRNHVRIQSDIISLDEGSSKEPYSSSPGWCSQTICVVSYPKMGACQPTVLASALDQRAWCRLKDALLPPEQLPYSER